MTLTDAILATLHDIKQARPLDQVPTLTIDESARYIGVSVSQFRELAAINGLHPRKIMGRMMYNRSHIDRYLEAQWQATENAAHPTGANIGNSHGARQGRRAPKASGRSPDSVKPKCEKSPDAKIVNLRSTATTPSSNSTASPIGAGST